MMILLAVTGAVVWLLVGLGLLKAFAGHPVVKRRLDAPRLFPYVAAVKAWRTGWLLKIFGKKSQVPPELATALRATSVEDQKHLRDVLVELDSLPTIRSGNAAIGVNSIFELGVRKPQKAKTPYTHPMQYPPFFIPGVPARNFYDPSEFEFTKTLEDAYPIIKDELLQLLAQNGAGFGGYVAEGGVRLAGWNAFNFFFFGKKYEENCALCPKTTAILESLPRFEKDHIMFSALNPHARIPPHVGPMNGILRAHLGLVVPNGCYIRVGPDEHTWEEGKVMVFDDSFEHEVWNHSDQVRIVLFMNFWHPCFSDQEIRVLERFRAAYERNPMAKMHADNLAAKRAHDIETKAIVADTRAA